MQKFLQILSLKTHFQFIFKIENEQQEIIEPRLFN